jgi:class 3 adenylate cyclase
LRETEVEALIWSGFLERSCRNDPNKLEARLVERAEKATGASRQALEAALEAIVAVHRRGDDAVMAGEPPLEIVVALHVGAVIYGNIGAADRFDFSVIGPLVNLVSRVETAKALNLPIVVSDESADRCVR